MVARLERVCALVYVGFVKAKEAEKDEQKIDFITAAARKASPFTRKTVLDQESNDAVEWICAHTPEEVCGCSRVS